MIDLIEIIAKKHQVRRYMTTQIREWRERKLWMHFLAVTDQELDKAEAKIKQNNVLVVCPVLAIQDAI